MQHAFTHKHGTNFITEIPDNLIFRNLVHESILIDIVNRLVSPESRKIYLIYIGQFQ